MGNPDGMNELEVDERTEVYKALDLCNELNGTPLPKMICRNCGKNYVYGGHRYGHYSWQFIYCSGCGLDHTMYFDPRTPDLLNAIQEQWNVAVERKTRDDIEKWEQMLKE